MGWFSRGVEERMATLSHEERREFEKLDEAVGLGMRAAKVVIAAGRALKVIRDRQLFRDTVATWEAYLDRHGLQRRRADQLIQAAEVLDAVAEVVSTKTGTTVPSFEEMTERTARNLVGMDAETAAEVVLEAAATPDGLTPATIKAAASKRRKAKAAKVPRPQRFRVPGATVTVVFNRKSNGVAVEALQAAIRQADADRPAEAA
jgi:hypothetical protein